MALTSSPAKRIITIIGTCAAVAGFGIGAWWVSDLRVPTVASDTRSLQTEQAESRPRVMPTQDAVAVQPSAAPMTSPSPELPVAVPSEPPAEQEHADEAEKGSGEDAQVPPLQKQTVTPERLAELQARVDELDARFRGVWARQGEITTDPLILDPHDDDPTAVEQRAILWAEYAALDAERLRLIVELAEARFQRDIATFTPQY